MTLIMDEIRARELHPACADARHPQLRASAAIRTILRRTTCSTIGLFPPVCRRTFTRMFRRETNVTFAPGAERH
jgi:hypothetical protein